MPKLRDQECENCQHFYKLTDSNVPKLRCGECRKKSPVHVDDDGYGHWPWVQGPWWCGDYHIIIEEK